MPSFGEIVERSLGLLQRRGRVSHTALRLEFGLDDEMFAALREELVAVLAAADDDDGVLVARHATEPAREPDAAGELAEHATPTAAGPPQAGRRSISVLLCDLDETPPLDALDAESRAVVGARFHAICGEVAGRLGGHVLPWVSDGVAIFFGHPHAQADDALRAVRCGWEILRTLSAAREVVEREFGVRLAARLAIATGAAGDDADGADPFGDVPRSAAAIQAQGVADRVTVDDLTRAQAHDAFGFEALEGDRFAVTGPADGATLAGSAPPALVGRTGERALLQALAERAAAGTRAAVLVRGEAGIGKTRLLEHVAATAGDNLGMTVVHCACSPYHRGSALHPVLTGLRRHWELDGADASAQLAARADGLPGGRRAVALLAEMLGVALVSEMLGVALPDGAEDAASLGPARRRRESLAALADVLAAETRRAPLLLVVEDLHWADASTLELIATLLDGPRELALMVALTARSDFGGLPQRTLQRIELGRLDAEETRRVVEHVAEAGSLPSAVAGELAQQAAGSPLLAAELTRTALATPRDAPAVGATLYGCLMARLDRDSAARDVAQLAATIGREFDRTLLDAVGTIEPAALDWGLERLVAENVVATSGPGRFAFCHSLLQDAARSSQPKRALRSHNLAIARALLAHFPHVAAAEPERVARHLEYARAVREAVAHWQLAGRQALDRHALREATLHFERAIELNARTPDGPQRRTAELDLRLLAGHAIAAHAGWKAPAAVNHHARAERLSRDVEASAAKLDALLRLTSYRVVDGRPSDALALALNLVAVAEAAADPVRLAAAECAAGGALVASGRHREALGHLARAIELSEPARSDTSADGFGRDPAVTAFAHRALALACRDDHEGARYAITAATELLHDRPRPHGRVAILCAAATAAHIRADHDDVLAMASAAIALATAEDLRERLAQARALHGWARVRTGAHDDGLGELREALAGWTATGAAAGGPLLHGLLADALSQAGEPERGLVALDEALTWVCGGERWYEPELHRLRAELLRVVGDLPGAQRSAGTAAALARRMRAHAWERRAAATAATLGSASSVV